MFETLTYVLSAVVLFAVIQYGRLQFLYQQRGRRLKGYVDLIENKEERFNILAAEINETLAINKSITIKWQESANTNVKLARENERLARHINQHMK